MEFKETLPRCAKLYDYDKKDNKNQEFEENYYLPNNNSFYKENDIIYYNKQNPFFYNNFSNDFYHYGYYNSQPFTCPNFNSQLKEENRKLNSNDKIRRQSVLKILKLS